MKAISIDIETFSSVDLKKCGVFKYCESPDFEILLFAYSVDGGEVEVVDLANGEEIPKSILDALTDDTTLKWAFNATFERVCLSRHLGLPLGTYLNPKSWRCSMVWGATLGLPFSLAQVGAVLNLDNQKMKEGAALIRYFCVPCKATKANGGRTRNLPSHELDKWKAFKNYNKRDVEVELSVQDKLKGFPVPDKIWDEYYLDQIINDRGIQIDMKLVNQAMRIDEITKADITNQIITLTGLENPNSVLKMRAWLLDNGLETDTLGKEQVAKLVDSNSGVLKEVLLLRQQLAKSSVKKYQAMKNYACEDNRARGLFQFYGANRTGRFAGRGIQLQNLPQNHMEDLESARNLVRLGDFEGLTMIYEQIPETLSELIRTAFTPKSGCKFIVADFSAIEARVIAWLAGETWRNDVFATHGKIYEASAAQMFKVPIESIGKTSELRQKGKQAELACIAEGELVLTDTGLVAIEKISKKHKLWDGGSWVSHSGLVYKGKQEVITYEGLTATRDHFVWVEGKAEPIQFGEAAARGAHLVQTGDGRQSIRMGEDNFSRETVEQKTESLLCSDAMYGLQRNPMDQSKQFATRKIKRLPKLLKATTNTSLVRQTACSRKATLRKPKRQRLSQLRWTRDKIRFFKRDGGGAVSDKNLRSASTKNAARSNRQQRKLRKRQHSLCHERRELRKPENNDLIRVSSRVLALCLRRGYTEIISGPKSRRSIIRSRVSGGEQTKKLAFNTSAVRVYDIRNAGPHHRFTVSNKLVHNCGYGGSVGALKKMGALEMGLKESELKPLVDVWRAANPNITKLWWDVDREVKYAVLHKTTTQTHGITFTVKSGMLFIDLPSGRKLAYVKPRMGINKFGGDCVTYEGLGLTKKWERLDSYGPKFVENIVQGMSRDILMFAMNNLAKHYSIVAHVHDECILEVVEDVEVDEVCRQMSVTPPWAGDLKLDADGYECYFYKKA